MTVLGGMWYSNNRLAVNQTQFQSTSSAAAGPLGLIEAIDEFRRFALSQ